MAKQPPDKESGGGKKTFVLRMQPAVFAVLERWAADEFRSTNGQIEYLLTDALRKAGRLPKRDIVLEPTGEEPTKAEPPDDAPDSQSA